MSWILSLQSYMFGDNQEAVVEAEEVRAEEEEEEEQEQGEGEVEVKVCYFQEMYPPCLRPHLCHINMKKG